MGIIEAREGATLAVGRVDPGLGRCGQVVAAVRVVEPGAFDAEETFPILIVEMLAFIVHGNIEEKDCGWELEICLDNSQNSPIYRQFYRSFATGCPDPTLSSYFCGLV